MKRFVKCSIRHICLLLILFLVPSIVIADGSLSAALEMAQNEAGKTTTTLVSSIDLDEFAKHYGLSLSAEDEMLIRIALLSYCNGAILEHPVGINQVQLASLLDDPYVGNRNSKKFHYSWCSSVSDMNEKNKVTFSTREEAVAQGYQPCKRCEP